MDDQMRCPIRVEGRECGLKTKPERMLYLGWQGDGYGYHHECEFHKFHIIRSDDGKRTSLKECDCSKH